MTRRPFLTVACSVFIGVILPFDRCVRQDSPVGEHLKYLVCAGERPLALCAWISAPRHLDPRDRSIGRSMTARRENIRFVTYDTRFLILPWVEVRHPASHLLGVMMRRLSTDS